MDALVVAASGLTDAEFRTFVVIGAVFLLLLIAISRINPPDEPSGTHRHR
ncbi:MAG TPA: hypothetical protein VIF43_01580 [Patescibacteria group bacterium]|jgi:hypothetical protein